MSSRLKLLVLTDAYPFGHSENFFETELETLRRRFAKVVVVPSSRCDRAIPPLPLPEHVTAFFEPLTTRLERIQQLLRMAERSPTLTKWLVAELRARSDIWLEPRGLYLLAWFVWHSLRTFEESERAVRHFSLDPAETIAYAYWSWPSALSALMLQDKYPSLATVARCHGGDVYEERHTPAYLPFRPLLANKLDRIVFISEHGRAYFSRKWLPNPSRLLLARLGVSAAPKLSMPSYGVNHDKPIELVSCSYAVGVKRLPLMHDSVRAAARLLPSQNVRWTHIGDGPMLANLRLKVAQDLEPNLTVRFLGHLDPSQVIAHYSQNAIDLFLSTSQNEGVPVSIMEAFSCGIPVVGPHVGGVPEIVDASSGVLVPIDGSPGAFAQAIVACMSDTQAHLSLREGARIRWANYYRAEDNFERFAEALEALDTERASRLSPHTIQNQ